MNDVDTVFAVRDGDGFYFCGYKQWDKQLRKAKLYRSFEYATITRDSRSERSDTKVVKVMIQVIEEYNPDLDY